MPVDSVFLIIDILILRIILLSVPKKVHFLKKIIKFLKSIKRRIDIFSAETQLKFILEN